MTKRLRRIIFYSFLCFFIVAGICIVLYTEGWRLDFQTFKIQKVGAIFIRSFPSDAQIFINNQPVKNKSWFLQNGTFVNNLFPKNYTVALHAEDFLPWKEHIPVAPSLVTELKYAVLVPQKNVLSATDTTDFWIANQNIIRQNSGNNLVIGDMPLSGNTLINWSNDGKQILTFDSQRLNYVVNDTTQFVTTSFSVGSLKKLGYNVRKSYALELNPDNSKELVYVDGRAPAIFDLQKHTATFATGPTIDGDPATYRNHVLVSQFFIFWTHFDSARGTTQLVVYDRFLKTRIALPVFDGENQNIAFLDKNKILALQKTGELYMYDLGARETKKIADDVVSFTGDADALRVATQEHGALEIFSFKDNKYWKFRLPGIGLVQKLIWYSDKEHLFVVYNNRIAFLDLADNLLENLITVAPFGNAQYDEQSNKLYFLDGTDLKSIEFPK